MNPHELRSSRQADFTIFIVSDGTTTRAAIVCRDTLVGEGIAKRRKGDARDMQTGID